MIQDASPTFQHKGATKSVSAIAGVGALLFWLLAAAGGDRDAVVFAGASGTAFCAVGLWVLTRKVGLTVTPTEVVCHYIFHTKRFALKDVLEVGTWVGRTRSIQVGSIAVLTVETATGRHIFEPFRMSRRKLPKLKSIAEDANRWIKHYKSTGVGGVSSD